MDRSRRLELTWQVLVAAALARGWGSVMAKAKGDVWVSGSVLSAPE
jgi:hypothetical protein